MKQLQNNFTTPEQSKRLLELGIPEWTADGLRTYRGIKVLEEPQYDNPSPCWSVGRLIEIYELCSGKKYERKSERLVREGNVSVMKELTIIEDVIGDIINARLYIYPHIDFSKLEE